MLQSIHHGRLVDVYGLRTDPTGTSVELVENDVLIGPDIQDERPPSSNKRDSEILYDFIAANPDNLQPRLLITREIGTTEFEEAFTGLSGKLRVVSPGLFGQDVTQLPFSVVPRNAGIQLTFAAPVGVGDDFFVVRDPNSGQVTGLKNTEAVQLLEITGDPNDPNSSGNFKVIPTRIVVRDRIVILDPVLLGSEGLQYQTRNNASGMPESADQLGGNIRIAVALEGPLSIPGIHEDPASAYIGINNAGFKSVVRDFRSGNRNDNSSDIARGFVRDAEPPRIVGQLLMYVERVEKLNDASQVVTLYKNERSHEIDRGDVVRFIDPSTSEIFGVTEVVVDPEDDAGRPAQQHVRVAVRRIDGLERLSPSIPPGLSPADRDRWLRQNAPKAVLIAEFTATRRNVQTGETYGDDPSNFLVFTPEPLPLANGDPSPQNQNISPFAGAIIRFTKPVDMATVGAFDSFFFATRDVLDDDAILEDFVVPRGIDPDRFNKDKFITPHLVVSRIFDEDGSQTSIRLQPTKGLFLNEEMRLIDELRQPSFEPHTGDPDPTPVPFEEKKFRYYLHLLGGDSGIRDLAGNAVDFQSEVGVRDFMVIPFSLDTRKRPDGTTPVFPDNLVVNVVRRFANDDEDEQPSLYRAGEVPPAGAPAPSEAFELPDVFGAVTYLADGSMIARPTSRVTKVVDDLNQQPPPAQGTNLRYCPLAVAGEAQVASATAGVRFGNPLQNPLNPFGSRVQTLWREIDMSLSRVDPFDFNLDVEQMYWAPFATGAITYDEFDRVTLFLGHSEFRPEPCVGTFSSLPTLPNSGLQNDFAGNYAHNKKTGTGEKEDDPAPHAAYRDKNLVIDATLAFTEPNGINRYLPLPTFQQPMFVWRDETVVAQGANSGKGSDVRNANQNMDPYIISPWLTGQGGRLVTGPPNNFAFNRGFWGNFEEFWLSQTTRRDTFTGGGVGSIALPLLADFWTYCDDPDLPVGNGFVATGFNGWQIALTVQSASTPNFRAFSGGFAGNATRSPICIDESQPAWSRAAGGYGPNGNRTTTSADNSLYWIMTDFVKRQTVVTAGFVEILNPHRMESRTFGNGDPRLGPFFPDATGKTSLPSKMLPIYDWVSEPQFDTLPGGTAVIPEFRLASMVDPEPWRWTALPTNVKGVPIDAINFPLDPLKACDAHIRKYDDRVLPSGLARNHWAYYYNRQVTRYTTEISDLSRDLFTSKSAGPNETFLARDAAYFNWRFIMKNNVDANPPISPGVDSFAVAYRFEKQ